MCPCTIKYLNFVCVSVTQLYLTLSTPWTVAHQAPLSKGFSRQEYWRGLPFPFPGDLPNPGIKPTSPALQVDSLLSEPPGKSPQFSDIKSPLLLGRKLRYIDAPPPLFASPRPSVHPPALHPQRNELHRGSLLPWGWGGSQEPIWWPVWGEAGQGQGLWVGEQEEGCGWRSSCGVCVVWGAGGAE